MLALLCKDEARAYVRSAEDGYGYQAWQALLRARSSKCGKLVEHIVGTNIRVTRPAHQSSAVEQKCRGARDTDLLSGGLTVCSTQARLLHCRGPPAPLQGPACSTAGARLPSCCVAVDSWLLGFSWVNAWWTVKFAGTCLLVKLRKLLDR